MSQQPKEWGDLPNGGKIVKQADGLAWLGCMVPAFLLAWLVYSLSSCEQKSPCQDDIGAFVISQDFVKRQLKSPSTAKFPTITEPGVRSEPITIGDGSCGFRVSLYVDAQNSFGGTAREHYIVVVKPDSANSRNWTLVEIGTQ